LNKEAFKTCVVDGLKVSNNTNLQRTYVGDSDGDMELAGLGIPPISLTDGTAPGSAILFKWCLHEVKALFDSQQYLKILILLNMWLLGNNLQFLKVLIVWLMVSLLQGSPIVQMPAA
jgi:hypothetical protein